MLKVKGNKKDKDNILEELKISIQDKIKAITNNINEIRKLNGNLDGIYPITENKKLVDGEPICNASSAVSASSDFMVSISTQATAAPGFALAEFFGIAIGRNFASVEGSANASCTCGENPEVPANPKNEKVKFEDLVKSLKSKEIGESKSIMNHEAVLVLKNNIQEKIKQIQEDAVEMIIIQKEIYEMGKAEGYKKTRQIIDGCNIDCTTLAIAFSFSDVESGTFTIAENNSAMANATAIGKNIALVFGLALVSCQCEE